jgi:hypothetical protein
MGTGIVIGDATPIKLSILIRNYGTAKRKLLISHNIQGLSDTGLGVKTDWLWTEQWLAAMQKPEQRDIKARIGDLPGFLSGKAVRRCPWQSENGRPFEVSAFLTRP